MDRLLKNVEERDWRDFKAEASRHGVRLGDFLGLLVNKHIRQESKSKSWEYILSRKARLSRAEADRMREAISTFDNVYGFEE